MANEQMDLTLRDKCEFNATSLVIHEEVTFAEWKDLGKWLSKVEGAIQFWVGDWARFGDKRGWMGKYTDPKVYDELEKETGYSRGTLKVYKSVSENVKSLTRVNDLSFKHHQQVAPLPPEKQQERTVMNEYEWVTFLYHLRGNDPPDFKYFQDTETEI